MLTAALAAAHAGDVYIYVYADWYAVLGVGDGAGVSGGFWLTLLILVGLAVAGRRLRFVGAEAERRAPDPDRLD